MENKLEHMMNNKSSWTPADRANFTKTWISYLADPSYKKNFASKILKQYLSGRNNWNSNNENQFMNIYSRYPYALGNANQWIKSRLQTMNDERIMKNMLNGKVPTNKTAFMKVLTNYIVHGGRNIEKYQGLYNTFATKNKSFRNNSNFEKFANKLANVVKSNRNLNIELNSNVKEVTLSYKHPNNSKSFVVFSPYRNKKGVYINFGRTSETARGQGIGTKLRAYGANAARLARVPLYQYGKNVEQLLPPGQVPISTRIMRGPGVRAVPIRKIHGKKKKYASAVLPRRNTLRSAKKSR